jgi:hypothetical protein
MSVAYSLDAVGGQEDDRPFEQSENRFALHRERAFAHFLQDVRDQGVEADVELLDAISASSTCILTPGRPSPIGQDRLPASKKSSDL